jgi:DNA-binding SARP family transcriptional activator
MMFTILGPLDVRLVDETGQARSLPLGPVKQRALLAALLCRANTFVPVDELIGTLWEDPPRTARKNVQVYISHLRRILAADGQPDRIAHRTRAYAVHVDTAELDAAGFEDLVREGRLALRGGHTAQAAATLHAALSRWRGDPLADLVAFPALRAEADSLAERRLNAEEDWIDAEMALGRHLEVLDELDGMVRSHPLRETGYATDCTVFVTPVRASGVPAPLSLGPPTHWQVDCPPGSSACLEEGSPRVSPPLWCSVEWEWPPQGSSAP